ncbi:MAG TPA: glycosyltransferase family 2 protein [Candidatus Polarisedimenticolia bacterium]|nr:glycosyltransferase family 2 protein [Candidatus Polarisedimenticolia bacterium]
MKPLVSIVIPVHGRFGLTRQCLESLLGQRPRIPWEAVVVDDASPEDLREALELDDDRLRILRRGERGGFARACNEGARSALGELLVFLNNDTLPRGGWLDALVDHAREHSLAGIVGSRLLYPDGSIQHAGVVICHDHYPRHVYAGFPGDHPAVTRPRRYQAVTAASMLVRREVFEVLSGFDTGYTNGLEDADFCLRAGRLGHEIHYAPDSVVVHLESVSPGRFEHDRENARLWMERWGEVVQPDDADCYLEDGLLRFAYGGGYPIRAWLSPQLAVVEGSGGRLEDGALLTERLRWQVSDLLREVARLTARIAEHEGLSATAAAGEAHADGRHGRDIGPGPSAGNGSGGLDGQAAPIEREILDLQERLSQIADFDPSPTLEYRALISRIRETAHKVIPRGSTAIVISRGDERLLEMDGLRCWHFPGDQSGRYTGYHPANAEEAIEHLESMRSRGAGYLLIPSTAFWWLDHYGDLRSHLESAYGPPRVSDEACFVYSLEASCRS